VVDLVKARRVQGAWLHDGKILVELHSGRIQHITAERDLSSIRPI